MKIKFYINIFLDLFKKKTETSESKKNDIIVKTIISIVLCVGSAILTIMNYIKGNTFMMWTTIGLIACFAICALIVGVFKLRFISSLLMTIVVASVFSIYAWYGENQGFAILWIIIVPFVTMLLFDFRLGFIVSVYFLLYLIVILYILPCFGIVCGINFSGGQTWYNEEFFLRFPALYFISFITSVFLSGQRIYYQKKAENNSLYDSMTGLKNRRFYTEYINNIGTNPVDPTFSVVSVDLNNLKVLNDMYGHDFGDIAIVETANILTNIFKKYTEEVFRTGGDEYLVFFDDKDHEIDLLMEKVKESANKVQIKNDVLSLSIGYASMAQYNDLSPELLISIAERNMYADKENYYRNFHGERRRENRLQEKIDKDIDTNKQGD